jgi:acyl-CoA synthetase (AMP-forming)/AMP-acid ligase II
LADNFNLASDCCVLATVPARHIYGILFGVLLPMTAGACFVRDTPFHPEAVADCIRRDHVDTLVSVPVHLRGLLNLDAKSVALRRVFSSGAAMPQATAVALKQRFGFDVTEIFGSSETGGIAFRDSLSQETWHALPGVEIAVDSQDRLLVSSPFADSDQGVPFVCADQVEIFEQGRFHHIGRKDGVVKIGGVRVSEKEVERKILSLPGVEDAVVKSVKSTGRESTKSGPPWSLPNGILSVSVKRYSIGLNQWRYRGALGLSQRCHDRLRERSIARISWRCSKAERDTIQRISVIFPSRSDPTTTVTKQTWSVTTSRWRFPRTSTTFRDTSKEHQYCRPSCRSTNWCWNDVKLSGPTSVP